MVRQVGAWAAPFCKSVGYAWRGSGHYFWNKQTVSMRILVRGSLTAVNIRKFVARAHSLDDLVALRSVSRQAADFLHSAVMAGLNIVVSGGTQAGKTTCVT